MASSASALMFFAKVFKVSLIFVWPFFLLVIFAHSLILWSKFLATSSRAPQVCP